MAKYTIIVSGKDVVFDAADIYAAQKYATSKGWNPDDVIKGDWTATPSTFKPKPIDVPWEADVPFKPVSPTPTTPTSGGTPEGVVTWAEAFGRYQALVNANPDLPFPVYKDVTDYMRHEQEWLAGVPYYQAGFSQEQIDSYDRVIAYAREYGNLEDDIPKDRWDYLNNLDKYQLQLEKWIQEAGPEGVGFTDDEIRRLNAYKQWYYQHGEPGDPFPVDAGDFIANEEKYQRQQAIWEQQAAEAEQYEIDPAEAGRRREESYAESRYAAQERYRETPEYRAPFTQWMQGQADFSGALQAFTEREYPSLRSEFQATQPRLAGFPTREEARAEATRREQSWQGWLSGKTPEIEERYWAQRPAERGERLWMQAPPIRTVNW